MQGLFKKGVMCKCIKIPVLHWTAHPVVRLQHGVFVNCAVSALPSSSLLLFIAIYFLLNFLIPLLVYTTQTVIIL